MTNWFNPDIKVYGRYDKKALKHSESLEQTPRDFDPKRDWILPGLILPGTGYKIKR